jgi:hypothetical protein
VVEYRFEPDALWGGLARLSWVTLAAVACGWVVLLLVPITRGRAELRPAAPEGRTAVAGKRLTLQTGSARLLSAP